MFNKRQNSPSRFFASEGKIANKNILPQEGGDGLDVAGYGRSEHEQSSTVPSLIQA